MNKRILLALLQFGVLMDPQIAIQGHSFTLHFLDRVLEFFCLFGGWIGCEFGEVQFSFAILDMAAEPPGYGLDLIVPGVNRVVAMTIIAAALEDSADGVGNSVMKRDVIRGLFVRMIFGGTNELNDDKREDQEEEDLFYHMGIKLT